MTWDKFKTWGKCKVFQISGYLKPLYCKGNTHIQIYMHNWVTWKWAPWELYFLERSCKFIKTNMSASNRKHFKAQQKKKKQLETPSKLQNTQCSCRITLMLVCSRIRPDTIANTIITIGWNMGSEGNDTLSIPSGKKLMLNSGLPCAERKKSSG